jgi:3',5'-cyclic AMP phosphodiesterase CpdA
MRSAVAEVNASPAAFTVFCGDLVDKGEAEANQKRYGEWLDIARGLKNEFTAVPGNHDPAALFTKHIRKETESVLDCKDYRILCFADAEPNPGHLGIVTEGQMKWLQARLDEAKKKDQRVILAAHVIYHARMRHGLPRKATGRIFCLLAALLRGERDPTGSTWLSCGTRGGGAVGHEGQAAGGQR